MNEIYSYFIFTDVAHRFLKDTHQFIFHLEPIFPILGNFSNILQKTFLATVFFLVFSVLVIFFSLEYNVLNLKYT